MPKKGAKKLDKYQWITSLISASSSLIGVVIGLVFNNINENRRFKREVEKRKLEEFENLKKQKIITYNKILAIDGSSIITRIEPNPEFNLQEYNSKIRPTFYDNLNVLGEEVRKDFREIDLLVKNWSVQTATNEDFIKANSIYKRIMEAINREYLSYS